MQQYVITVAGSMTEKEARTIANAALAVKVTAEVKVETRTITGDSLGFLKSYPLEMERF